jgi:hypothetical protein
MWMVISWAVDQLDANFMSPLSTCGAVDLICNVAIFNHWLPLNAHSWDRWW